MVRSDLASSGVAFTLDPDTGFRDAVVITGSYGLGESVVGGKVDPDEIQVSQNIVPAVNDSRLIFLLTLTLYILHCCIPGVQTHDW